MFTFNDKVLRFNVGRLATGGALAALMLVAACSSSSNDPATGTGGSTATGTGGTVTGSGGATATAGTATTGSGGTTTTTGAGGSTSTAGASVGTPLCGSLTTAAGVAPTKAGVCTAADPQLCYKTCGPLGKGFKSETCTAGAYAEQSGCTFPPADYSCFKVPAARSAECAAVATTPQASQLCTIPECDACSDASGSYLDSGGALKAGYCVCQAANASGERKWSCASTNAWPCPSGSGCQ